MPGLIILGYLGLAYPQWWLERHLVWLWILGFAALASCLIWERSGPRKLMTDLRLLLTTPRLDVISLLTQLLHLAEISRRAGLSRMSELKANWRPLQDAGVFIATATPTDEIREHRQRLISQNQQRFDDFFRRLAEVGLMIAIAGTLFEVGADRIEGRSDLAFIEHWVWVLPILALYAMAKIALANENLAIELTYEATESLLKNNSSAAVFQALIPILPKRAHRKFVSLYSELVALEQGDV